MYTSALPLLHDEKFSGVTLHKIDAGIDTGDIIVQKKFEILKDETARELYLKYINYGTKLIIDNLSNLLNMDFTISRQEVNGSSYYGKKCIDYNNLKINYNQTSYQISNQIRAYTFREYQLPKFQDYDINGWEYTFNKSNLIPGSIVNKCKYSIEIATIDYNIILKIDQFMSFINACKANNDEFVNELITNCKIDLETRTVEGWTPLIIAAYFGAYEVVELLVNAGANINAINYNGTTVLMYAKNNLLKTNDKRIVDLLFEHGVNTELIDNYGKNVLDWLKVESEEYYQYFKNK
jgi:methionyl-tRNA formyltransferase